MRYGPGVQDGGTRSFGRGMIVAAWVILLALLTYSFTVYLELKENPNRDPQSSLGEDGVAQVVLRRNSKGHYVASGSINGIRVTYLLDTGATDVAVSERLADRLRLSKGALTLSRTANGTVRSWNTRLQEVRLGKIRMNNVRASVLPGMQGSEVLLGMSFLKHLEMVQRGDILTLRQF